VLTRPLFPSAIQKGHPKRKIVAATAVFAALISAGPDMAGANTPGYELEAVVLVNRHGVRSPISQDPSYKLLARQKWPDFGVPEGYLTKRGGKLAKIMGAWYGQHFRDSGLLPQNGCLPDSAVWVHADNSQRTIVTAQKMQKGMLPGCSYPVTHVADGTADPLIDPTGAGICEKDDVLQDAAMAALIGSSQTVVDAYQASLSQLQDVLDCCRPKLCRQASLEPGCKLTDLTPGDMVGAATVVSENFLMEYADKLPLSQVGWGRASSPATISHINMTHALNYWAYNANPYGAGVEGSNLMNYVLTALTKAAGAHGLKGPVLSLIVAHDNNLLNVAGLLGSSWFLDSYQQSEVPPGAGIAFELWRNTSTGKLYVDIVVRAQTMRQLRKAQTLSPGGSEPAVSNLTPLVCKTTLVDGYCPFDSFKTSLASALNTECIGDGSSR